MAPQLMSSFDKTISNSSLHLVDGTLYKMYNSQNFPTAFWLIQFESESFQTNIAPTSACRWFVRLLDVIKNYVMARRQK